MNANDLQKRATVLVVDDEARNVKLLETLLHAEGYATLSASNGGEGIALAETAQPDLILLDVMMPDMDGFETVARLKADPRTKPVPVIMVTALDDRDSKLRALQAGAEEFLSKPIDRADLTVRVRNLLRLKEYGDFLANHNRMLDEQVKQRTAELEEAYRDTVFTLVRAAEHKDEETGHHVRRISHYCKVLAEAMNMPADFHDAIFHASPMHDIGKIGIADHVLLKPGGFTPEEWIIMQAMSPSAGTWPRNCSRASRPPAEAPMATIGKGRDAPALLGSSAAFSGITGVAAAFADRFAAGTFLACACLAMSFLADQR